MWMRVLFLAAILADLGCGGLTQVNIKAGAGGEIRGHADTDYRTSIGTGPELQFKNGVKATLLYRNRLTDMQADTMEHGFFVSTSIPIWRAR